MRTEARYDMTESLVHMGYSEDKLYKLTDEGLSRLALENTPTTKQEIRLAEDLPVMSRSMKESIGKAMGQERIHDLFITIEVIIKVMSDYRNSKSYIPEEWSAYLIECEEILYEYFTNKAA